MDSVNACIRRWRRLSGPPSPETLQELAILLTTEEWRNVINHNSSAMEASFVGEGNETSLLIYDPRLIRIIENTATVIIDLSYGVHTQIE